MGNQRSGTDASAITWTATYDARNRPVSKTVGSGTTSIGYDLDSNPVTTTDALGVVTTCTFDARNRKTQCVDRVSGTTKFTYDAVSNLRKIEDADAILAANSQATDYEYNSRNLLITEIFPTGTAGRTQRVYTYDGGRRLTSRTVSTLPASSFSEVTNYSYDTANRLLTRSYPADGKNDSFTYDVASRLLTANSARYRINVTRAYDAASRLTSEQQQFLDGTIAGTIVSAATYTVGYGYDNDNRQTSVTYPDGKVVTRTFTNRNELDVVSLNSVLVADRTYAANGLLTTTVLGLSLIHI